MRNDGKGSTQLYFKSLEIHHHFTAFLAGQLCPYLPRYQVESVASGEAAIEHIKSKKADLVVLDMIMDPGMDGMETYRRILEIHLQAIFIS